MLATGANRTMQLHGLDVPIYHFISYNILLSEVLCII